MEYRLWLSQTWECVDRGRISGRDYDDEWIERCMDQQKKWIKEGLAQQAQKEGLYNWQCYVIGRKALNE